MRCLLKSVEPDMAQMSSDKALRTSMSMSDSTLTTAVSVEWCVR